MSPLCYEIALAKELVLATWELLNDNIYVYVL